MARTRHICLRWHEPGIQGYMDVIPATVVDQSSNGSIIEHEVLGPRRGHYGLAKCRIAVDSRAVELDYSSFDRLNTEREMEIGVLRLVFTTADRNVVARVEWRDRRSKRFIEAEATPVLPTRMTSTQTLYEGAAKSIRTRAFIRDPRLRRRCIAHHGSACYVCGFDFEAKYGAVAAGFIHVHHLEPLARYGRRHAVDPVKHLRPVCPNCHAVLHLRGGLGISDLKKQLSGRMSVRR